MLFSTLKQVSFKGRIDIIDCEGKIHSFGSSSPHVKIKFKNKSIERKIFFNPSLYIGEAYMNKELIIEEGTIDDFINIISTSYKDVVSNHWVHRFFYNIATFFRSLQQLNHIINSKKNVSPQCSNRKKI